ncbi:hypothetical protein NDU88_004440 [Pleurodeles waltl]|uniref:Uncharacterized protein n=1 Tax=Pleurodeles waltl TaxID=8319 RepID=A0AAV7PCH9_PLEWA|nr:hypothetical protein NDU88_004440 [Pleurodeles waltl]
MCPLTAEKQLARGAACRPARKHSGWSSGASAPRRGRAAWQEGTWLPGPDKGCVWTGGRGVSRAARREEKRRWGLDGAVCGPEAAALRDPRGGGGAIGAGRCPLPRPGCADVSGCRNSPAWLAVQGAPPVEEGRLRRSCASTRAWELPQSFACYLRERIAIKREESVAARVEESHRAAEHTPKIGGDAPEPWGQISASFSPVNPFQPPAGAAPLD